VRTTPQEPYRITKADFMGAFWSFWLVVISSAPAAIPFLVVDDAFRALRISNAILLAILFFTGYKWARYTLGNPWVVGLIFLSGGIGLVLMAIALGG
jgi:VIT1/CCC1 family predicted Fe2+/Mn2+ transporter